MFKLAGLAIVAMLAGYGIHAFAQARIDVRPAVAPLGTSSAGGVSYAWFYEPNGRTVYVCHVGPAPKASIDCGAKARLP